MKRFSGQVAVVTGGGSGIGAALCRLLANAEMRVVVADIDAAAAEVVAKSINEAGGHAVSSVADITKDASLARLVTHVEALWGECDLLCANAGVMVMGRLANLSRDDWQWVLTVNLLGTVQTVQHFLPLLRASRKHAHIVITSSMAGLLAAGPYKGAYNVTKHGLMAYGETLREELKEEGIGVSMLLPAGVQSRIAESGRSRQPEFGSARPLDPADIKGIMSGTGGDVAVDADYAVRNVLEGVADNRPWIITHTSSQKALIEQRFAAIMQAFDDTADPPGRELSQESA